MPIYEYRRPDGTTFEIQQSFSDDALTVDPDTGVPVERVLHAPAVHFKGKGFYNTDYGTRKRQRETAAAAEGSSARTRPRRTLKDSSSRQTPPRPPPAATPSLGIVLRRRRGQGARRAPTDSAKTPRTAKPVAGEARAERALSRA